jgi:protein TonB
MGRPRLLIGAAEHVGEQGLIRARSPEMSDGSPLPPLPPLGDTRPTRSEDVLAEVAGATTPLLLDPDRQPASGVAASADRADIPLTLPPGDPARAPAIVVRHPIRHTASVIAACGAHVAVLLALVSTPPVEFGYGGTELDAISVSIVPASAIATRQPAAEAAQAAPSNIAPNPGEDSTPSAPAPEKAAYQETPNEQPRPDEAELGPKLAAPLEEAPVAAPEEAPRITSPPKPPEETKLAVVEPPPVPTPPEKPVEERPKEDVPTPPSPAAEVAGGAAADGNAPDQVDKAAQAAAAAGSRAILAYGTAVQSALMAVDQRDAKARASALQAKGTVVVRLTLDDRGALVKAEIVKSSGRPQLDDAALLLIRLAAFPPPPPGLTADQRAYIAPIRFQ